MDEMISVVIPSLNEEATIADVITKAKKALEEMGVPYEIIISDNSTDRTPEIARSLGARVVTPDRLGYGYAYIYAFKHVRGRYVVMGDADGTYNFTEMPKLLNPLINGEADIVTGTRLKGKIMKGAMPWLHRYIGNPALTWLLNKFYHLGISDSQCGFRAMTKEALEKLDLRATGMDLATEILIKARQKGLRIKEVPISYYPRAEGARSKLRSFRDGWRHLKYMLLYTPKHLYIYPGFVMVAAGIILMIAAIFSITLGYSPGIHSSILGGMLTILGYNMVVLGALADAYLSWTAGTTTTRVTGMMMRLSGEKGAAIGVLLLTAGFAYLLFLFIQWVNSGFRYLPIRGQNMLALTALVLGIQTVIYSFILELVRRISSLSR
jgi:glycosyltransferase involved in cell wall biosynthesis